MNIPETNATGPLAGLRILDLSTVLAGPQATQILADYGADVIKIEPLGGDVIRHGGHMRNPRMGDLFLNSNRNKRSLAIDVKTTAGRQAVLALCKHADALVHNIRPNSMARLGLAYSDVVRSKADIVYVNLVGYGKQGVYSGQPAYDDLIQGICGFAAASVQSPEDPPRYAPLVIADRVSGMMTANALLAALVHRQRTGVGQEVEVAMYETMVQLMLADHFGGHTFSPALGSMGYNRLTTVNRRPYKTRDGYICVLIYTDRQWHAFAEATGCSAMLHPHLADHASRAKHYDEAYGLIASLLVEQTSDHWRTLCAQLDIPATPLRQLEELENEPHIQSSQFISEWEHPSEGTVKQCRTGQTFSQTPANIYRHAPNLGEQSCEILREAGLTTAEIDRLVETKVIKQFVYPSVDEV